MYPNLVYTESFCVLNIENSLKNIEECIINGMFLVLFEPDYELFSIIFEILLIK